MTVKELTKTPPKAVDRGEPRVVLRARIDEWLGQYIDCLDDKRLDEWPEFFEEECFYSIVPKENDALGYELGLMRCESRRMLQDRAYAIKKTVMYGPRDIRHFFSGLIIREIGQQSIQLESNFLVVETLNDELPRVFAVGRSYDEVVPHGERFLFRKRKCVYTSNLIPNTLIIPI